MNRLIISFSLFAFAAFIQCTEPKSAAEEQQKAEKTQAPTAKDTALGPNEFAMQEGDTTYIMKQYYLAFLKSGPKRDQDSTTAAQLQMQHLAHLDSIAGLGKLDIVGPFGDDTKLRGIAMYNVETQAEAEMLANADPAVKAGRLVIEIHPIWLAKGSKLR